MSFQMTDSQQTVLHISATDRKGNPTTVAPGSVTYLVDNPNVLSLTPSGDGQSCAVAAVGPLGNATVTVNADVNGSPVSGTFAIEVISGAPTQIAVIADAPTEQP